MFTELLNTNAKVSKIYSVRKSDELTTKRSCSPVCLNIQLAFKPFMRSGLFCNNSLDQSISNMRGVLLVLIITMFYRNFYT